MTQSGISSSTWDFWIDRGGTFTDVIGRNADGRFETLKLLSENPDVYEDAAIEGIRRIVGVAVGSLLSANKINTVRMGTTVATNALLERKGAPTLLLITRGFADALEIGTQARPDIFALNILKPTMLYSKVAEVPERLHADGTVELALDEEAVRRTLQTAYDDGLRAVAVVFMHAYRTPDHELIAGRLAQDIGFSQISLSHEVSPLIKLIGRGDTSVADAYLTPLLRRYVDQIERRLGLEGDHKTGPRLSFMRSSGGLVPAQEFQGRDAILSGPAGGVVGAVKTAQAAGFDKIIGFDMGGTSTDVFHFAGQFERSFETEVAGVRLRAPMLDIHTIAAGGGSVLTFDAERFRVGPHSAGADPGPRCYRKGGPLSLTDANVMLGKLRAAHFPHIFGPGENAPLDEETVHSGFAALSAKLGGSKTPEDIAAGFVQIAAQNMANAIKKISVERGHDVTEYTLNGFGGAAGQVICLVADILGIKSIFLHPLSGLLSAYGMGRADITELRQKSFEQTLGADLLPLLHAAAETLAQKNIGALVRQNNSEDLNLREISVLLRYSGTDLPLAVRLAPLDDMIEAFEAAHKAQFGFNSPGATIDVALVEVLSVAASQTAGTSFAATTAPAAPTPAPELAKLYMNNHWHQAPVILRQSMRPKTHYSGPALIIEPHQTIAIEPGWRAELTDKNNIVLQRISKIKTPPAAGTTKADPVLLEVFNNLFMAIAEQMGVALQNTARSVNIKERLDFSCAVFDASGHLVANAPHMPVHLGSMDRSVEAVINHTRGSLRPDDVYMLNAPYNGGTHLPDITVVTPVFGEDRTHIHFYLASRGHHADIGGIAPGSMSPHARTIHEEGIYIDPFKLVENGVFRETACRALLDSGPYPARNTDMNIADLKAQVAANRRGILELNKMTAHFGERTVGAYMQHVQDNAASHVAQMLGRLFRTGFSQGLHEIKMDNGSVVCVAVSIDRKTHHLTVDFTGTSGQKNDNFNAPEPVTRAAVLYVMRCLVDQPVPMNAGCLRPVTIILPEGSMLSPRFPAAVVAGNVETSQVVTNCLFAAFGALGTAQGSMNNLTFGNAQYQYYETLCSGAPAGPGFHGADAVHTHMTNSRLTDPEVLELRYPVLLEEFKIRRGSGGKGKWSAGDGTLRVLRFLQPMECAILSGFRTERPTGLLGGFPGACGKNMVRRKDGSIEPLDACDQTKLAAGEAIIIQTPTGGGFGKNSDA